YSKGRLVGRNCTFELLGFDPVDFFNSNDNKIEGFFYKNYAPTFSERMYFTADNAARIDYFRWQIETWKEDSLLTEYEYVYLLACLLETVSAVSNTAGVYGAFLKHWDPRAKKQVVFTRLAFSDSPNNFIEAHNSKIEDIVSNVECDLIYLDPPYTQNQYGTQYHLLETLILNDEPTISKITGSRSTTPMRSDWSKDLKAHILFDKIIAQTKAKYILFSYNNDGFMTKSFIEASLKRYGKPETYVCKKIEYKKYRNFKTKCQKEHFEYLFFIEKKMQTEVVYESPLNYIGSKAKIINDIKENLPQSFDLFIDAFGGGFNVGINIDGNVIYNDYNRFVAELVKSFKTEDTYQYLMYIRKMTKKFQLQKADAESYNKARFFYNSLPVLKRDPKLLYTIILYGFQQQIRFNSSHEFNNPVGMRWFNDKVLEKFISFSRKIKESHVSFFSTSYAELKQAISEKSFIYLDPPYSLTTGAYNDGKRGFNGWDKLLERGLFEYLDFLNQNDVRFMLSYVIEHKGITNEELLNWVKTHHYKVIKLGDILGISGSKRKEVLIVNYEK
ncbi:DNA adenine methylase, partial [Chryseobacterium sp.]|uniref:DNA adenine methylase n=1 Tax=Chryseobacterium sp. TaxID=1871047 RepID=UPI002FCADC8B